MVCARGGSVLMVVVAVVSGHLLSTKSSVYVGYLYE